MRRTSGEVSPAPRVLLVAGARWPRALLRAQLIEAGYDVVGAQLVARALRYPAAEPGRGPVLLIIIEQAALALAAPRELERLRARHPSARVLLLASATVAPPSGSWDVVLRRPLAIEQIVRAVRELVPLPGPAERPDA